MSEDLIGCPACDLQLRRGDLTGQKEHMEAAHPEIIEQRLRDAGFERDAEGNWFDTLAATDEAT